MKSKKDTLKTVMMSSHPEHYQIKVRGPHTGLYDSNNKWICWLSNNEVWQLKDLGVK